MVGKPSPTDQQKHQAITEVFPRRAPTHIRLPYSTNKNLVAHPDTERAG